MADIKSGRARRMLSVGRLTTAVGGSYLWQAIKRPFQSASRTEQALLEAHIRNAERVVVRSKELRGAFMKLAQMLSMRGDILPAEALEVLSVIEAVQENPRPILDLQTRRAVDELIARLKAEGVEYEERMRRLEEVTYPKPEEEFLYQTFREFASRYPWARADDVRPKSIAPSSEAPATGSSCASGHRNASTMRSMNPRSTPSERTATGRSTCATP